MAPSRSGRTALTLEGNHARRRMQDGPRRAPPHGHAAFAGAVLFDFGSHSRVLPSGLTVAMTCVPAATVPAHETSVQLPGASGACVNPSHIVIASAPVNRTTWPPSADRAPRLHTVAERLDT